ncbi:MAG: hypothetical protein ABS44_11015 [Chryseobacterium sp. SCN 40-13]|nr:MAG: hypothetical protein ABS44_11015 [Chryseobacterium sp. SCN 40-13]
MREFKYILKDKSKTLTEVEQNYVKMIQANLSVKRINDSQVLEEILLCSSEKMNEKMHSSFIKKLRPKSYYLVFRKGILFDVFFGKEYSQLQPVISKFISENFSFKICPYCGIDYVNSFKECLSYFSTFNDFLLNSTYNELIRMNGIGEKKARNILKDRSQLTVDKFTQKYLIYENAFKSLKLKPQFHNHYTLDHITPKAKYPLFQISLYNLIPVCYSCNTKFKGEYVLPECVIPNSTGYKLDHALKFCLVNEMGNYKIDYKLNDCKESKDIQKYMREFKIIGRYNEHLDVVLRLKENADKYNKQKILEISRQTGISISKLNEMIFGYDIFNSGADSHLFKLKTDISTDLGII